MVPIACLKDPHLTDDVSMTSSPLSRSHVPPPAGGRGRSTIPPAAAPARGADRGCRRVAPRRGGRSEISGGPRYRMSHWVTFV